jgi:hypothetical protein
MTPVWLNNGVQHISQSLPDEEWNIIKKRVGSTVSGAHPKGGFLETVRAAQEVTRLEKLKQQENLKFKELVPEVRVNV